MTAIEELVIGRSDLRALVGSLSSTLPAEGCGVLLGQWQDNRAIVHDLSPAANRQSTDRSRSFELSPHDLAAALASGRRRSLRLLGFYHSHPRGPAVPSRLDRVMAWPDTVQIIAGFGSGEPDVKAWLATGSGQGWRPLVATLLRELAA